ncbi:MAG: type II secretion system protein [Candidatus Hydrogenedentes bacterium]|nr:type II secretion system protein [Candidatus Hydrogenedentota bacterium]
MIRQNQRQPGFSLVEMIIVMAVIALLASIAVPGLAKMGLFSKDTTRAAARELYTLMKAAQVYATTYHVDTAIVYRLRTRTDSVTGTEVAVVDAMAMARAMRIGEYEFTDASGKFVPVRDDNGGFQLMRKDAAILLNGCDANAAGFIPVELWDARSQPITQIISDFTIPAAGPSCPALPFVGGLMPAHVFKPNGTIKDTVANNGGRVKLFVGPAPDALPQERYADTGRTVPVAPYIIELYPTMGRLKITYGEPT